MKELNIKELIELYKENPEAFEEKRKKMINDVIESASKEHQRRLKGIQFQVDCIIEKSSNPMQASLEISKLMWDSLHNLHTVLLNGAAPSNENIDAKVLSFEKD